MRRITPRGNKHIPDYVLDTNGDCKKEVRIIENPTGSKSSNPIAHWSLCPNHPPNSVYGNQNPAFFTNVPFISENGLSTAATDPTWDPMCVPSTTWDPLLCGGGAGTGTPAYNAAVNNNYELWYASFYQEVVSQVGPINPGDVVSVTETACFGINDYCMIYLGHSIQTTNAYLWHDTVFNSITNDCNDCDLCYCPPPEPNGWDCDILGYKGIPPTPFYGCIERFTPQVGAFPTEQDCINSPCHESSGWDCEIIGYKGVPLTPVWDCVEKFLPQVGSFSTEQSCLSSTCGDDPLPSKKKNMTKVTPRGSKNITGYVRNANGHYILNSEYFKIYGDGSKKIITDFKFDLGDLPYTTETRNIVITGDSDAKFILEIKNAAGNYYDFTTQVFQATYVGLEGVLTNGSYKDTVVFPTVGSDDQYDVYLTAKEGTKHIPYIEKRFGDESIDINGSIGSNSLLMQKVIYQYATLTLTLSPYSVGGTVSGTNSTDTLTIFRNKSVGSTAFSISISAAGTAAYRILRQPTADDVVSFLQPVIGSAPIALPNENIYPTATAAFTGDDVNGAVTSGAVVRMDNTDLSAVIKVGDKITTTVMTDTVNGAVTSGVNIVMDAAVASKMAVGDRVTSSGVVLALDAKTVTVAAINVGSDANTFALSEAVAISDGVTLSFSSKINRSLTTVTVVETSGTATDFTMSQDIQFRDNAPLTFFNQKNYRWPINNYVDKIKKGMIVMPATNVTVDSSIGDYLNKTVFAPNTKYEKTIIDSIKPALDTIGKKPTIVKGLVTVQEGNIVFDKQQVLALAGDTLKIGGYRESEILRLYGWEVTFSNLAITLTAPTTITTEATSAHATIAVADREGVINNVSRVGGIGIDSSIQNPLITSGGGADGAGDWVMDAVQTLENGTTLTIENTGRVATITGNIKITRAGTANQTLRFDVNELLSLT